MVYLNSIKIFFYFWFTCWSMPSNPGFRTGGYLNPPWNKNNTKSSHNIELISRKEKYRLSYRWSPSVDSSPLLCKFFNLEAKEKLLPCLNQIFANKCYFFSFSSDTKNIWYFFLNSYLINPPSSKPHEHLPEATSALRFHLGAASVCCQVLTQHSTIMGHFNLF